MTEYKYKDSGVAWIGQIPEHWDTIKLKYTSWLKGRIGWQGLTSDEYQDEGPYLITGTDFVDGKINWDTCVRISEERYEEDSDIHIHENDLLITKDGTIGKVAVAKNCPSKVSLNSGVMLIRNTRDFKYHDQYLYYVLLSDEFWLWYEMNQTGASTIRHLYQEQFYNFEFSYPPIEEQRIIADYLDKKVKLIDSAIQELELSIEDFRGWMQSVIHEVTARGMAQKVPLKNTGVDWVKLIPEHWEMKRIKYLSDFKAGVGHEGNWDIEGKYVIVNSRFVSTNGEVKKYTSEALSPLNKDDICIVLSDLPNGRALSRCYLVEKDNAYTLNQRVGAFCNYDMDSYYFMYVMDRNHGLLKYDDGFNQTNLKYTDVLNCAIPVPPNAEQIEIGKYIIKQKEIFDSIIQEKENLIVELQNYKKSLIFEVVSGKRKVV